MDRLAGLLVRGGCFLLLLPALGAAQGQTAVTPGSDRVITATRVTTPIAVDARFDDEVYLTVEPTRGFIQQDPREGDPATEATEVWVLFDDKNLYIAAKCYDSQPDRMISTELRRDNPGIFNNESVAIVIDTFHDLRNGFRFQTNALGAFHDSVVADEVNVDSWNTVWEVRSAKFDWG